MYGLSEIIIIIIIIIRNLHSAIIPEALEEQVE